MNHYELLCIISGKMAETEIGGYENTIEDMLKKIASTVNFTHHLDRKKLTYPIDHHAYGYYFLAEFDAEPQNVSRIERELTLMNDVLRHSIAQKKLVGAPPVAPIERKQSFDSLPTLDEMPMKSSAQQAVITPHVPSVQPAIEVPQEQPIAIKTPVVQMPEPIEISTPAPVIATVSTAKDEDEDKNENEPILQKKKQAKLSYEELDKKLDEIINNDLF